MLPPLNIKHNAEDRSLHTYTYKYYNIHFPKKEPPFTKFFCFSAQARFCNITVI